MSSLLNIILGAIAILIVLAFVVMTIIRSEEPARMVVKWFATVLVLGFMFWKVAPLVGAGGYGGAFVGMPLTAVCGLFLAIIWRHTIADLIATPFGNLYSGGKTPPTPQPLYSTAQALQKQGRYHEAIFAAREQLEKFPRDLEGHMLIAEVQAVHLQDLPGAEQTIEQYCAQPAHHPKNIAFVLYAMADWYLAVGRDREGAERCFNRILERLPDTEFSLGAAQRLAHLASPDMIAGRHDERVIPVPETDQRMGLRAARTRIPFSEVSEEDKATYYVEHLQAHPLDWEAREKLAAIYADHYQRLDLATDQIEQLVAQPNAPSRNVVRWLNLLADIQVRSGADYESVKATLERIIERNPEYAAADQARSRISRLKLEIRGKEKNQAVKLGSYEKNIGLKSSRSLR
jgi:tetratricopeptide (TPR) repeat protein